MLIRNHKQPITVRTTNGLSKSIGTLSGYIAMFGVDSEDMGGYREQVGRTAFDKIGQDVICLHNHNTDICYGRSSVGTLRLWTDDKGLAFECSLPDTTDARNLMELVKRGDVTGCSFVFTIDSESWVQRGRVRLDQVTLYECSIGVSQPAYPDPYVKVG